MKQIIDHRIGEDLSRGRLIGTAVSEGCGANCPAKDLVRPILHQLISAVPPGQRVMPDLRKNFATGLLLILLSPVFSESAFSQSHSQNAPPRNETARAEELIKLARAAIGGEEVLS